MINQDGFSNITKEQIENMVDHVSQVVQLEKVTYTEDFRGDLTKVFAEPINITVYFVVRRDEHTRDKEAYVKRSPAYMMSKAEDDVGEGDRITANNVQYKVFDAINRFNLFVSSDLYLWGDK